MKVAVCRRNGVDICFDGSRLHEVFFVLESAGAMWPWPTLENKDRVIAILRLNGFEVEDRT